MPGRTVVYAYRRTGQPGVAKPEGWDMIPDARGCSPQSCSFRDHFAALLELGVDHLCGLSTQDTAYQSAAARRLRLPLALLSDEKLELAGAARLPAFEAAGLTLLRRFTLVIDDGRVTQVSYPVFPPDQNASDVAAWLAGEGRRVM